jgi:uroporphyrinogen-III synthase
MLPLEGRTVALAETRQLEDLAQLLEQEGARTLRCPMVSILDAPDPEPVLTWLRLLINDQMPLVVVMTGEAIRRLLAFAERAGMREAFLAALGRTRTLVRGPKPVKVMKDFGLVPSCVVKVPTTEGVIASLREESVAGKTVGVTRYGDVNETLENFLAEAGATVRPVMPYVYAPASDDDRVVELIRAMAAGTVDVLVLTSSPQIDRLFEIAEKPGLESMLRQGLERVRVAAVGPVVAETFRQRQAPVHICPEQGFVMKNLVQHIKKALAAG